MQFSVALSGPHEANVLQLLFIQMRKGTGSCPAAKIPAELVGTYTKSGEHNAAALRTAAEYGVNLIAHLSSPRGSCPPFAGDKETMTGQS